MEIIYIIVILLCFLLMYIVSTYNKIQSYIIKINEVEANIDSILRKRFDLLNKSITIIKELDPNKNHILNDIENLRTKKLTNFELDRKIYESINEFNNYVLLYPKLEKDKNYFEIKKELEESEPNIEACRKFYNDTTTNYNKFITSFPPILIAKLIKQKKRPYFDNKNMDDDIINDFKL